MTIRRIRSIADEDWDSVTALEASAYAGSGLAEGRAMLQSRVRASPATCFVLQVGPQVAAYLLSLPYPASCYPDLTRAEERVFRSANLHLHDLVVGTGFRGAGLARDLLRRLTATARSSRYERISLVAVAGSDRFWAGHGYRADPAVALPPSYGAHAVYMSRAI